MTRIMTLTATAVIALATAGSAQAQEQQASGAMSGTQANAQGGRDAQFTPIGEWNYETLYQQGAFRGDDLQDAEVFGAEGDDMNEEIGDVETVFLDQQGQIVAIVAEVGGFWDMADTHVAVPWDQITFVEDGIRIPVNEETIEEYSLFRENGPFAMGQLNQARKVDDDIRTSQRIWRLSELVDDYAVLRDGAGYGYVDDALFDKRGQLQAVVITRDSAYGTGGRFAYPYQGYDVGWQPGFDFYQLPYEADEVAELDTFDFDRMDDSFWD